jgi:hypothetical protein
MAETRNTLIANGQELIGALQWPKSGPGEKWHPYTLDEVRAVVHPQLQSLRQMAIHVSPETSPRREITACVDLHPAFLAKSYYPAKLFRDGGMSVLGSRSVNRAFRKHKEGEDAEGETISLFVAGNADQMDRLDQLVMNPAVGVGHIKQIRTIEEMRAQLAVERVRLNPLSSFPNYFHATLHANRDDGDLIEAFVQLVIQHGGKMASRGFRFVPGLAFVAFEASLHAIASVSQFTRLRILRSVPELRTDIVGAGSVFRSFGVGTPVNPNAAPVNGSARAAIFDGGTAGAYPPALVTDYVFPNSATPSPAEAAHGSHVTSAFLFGCGESVPGGAGAYCGVDHFRVLPTTQTPDQALDVLDRIVASLQYARTLGIPYKFANISLGPVATFFDDDVHEWTSRLDVELSDGQTLCTVAVGNNGALQNELGRIQPPGDAVNSFAIGAADSEAPRWQKAPYSAFGPGRSPGYVKPDAVAFGGSAAFPFQLYSPQMQQRIGVAGTSYASPLTLRTAAGVDALSRGVFRPVTLQALLINSCEFNARKKHTRPDVGWGRIRHIPEDIIETPPDVVRIVYQGVTRPGMPQIARIPVPKDLPADLKIKIGATFVYRAPVDPAHAANYTRAGLWVRSYAAKGRPLSLFGSGMYRTEASLRKDGQRWDTVLSAVRSIDAGKLDDPYFHINYQVRDEGEAVASKDADPLPYALIVTIEAPGANDLLARIQQQYPVLQTLQVNASVQAGI